MLFGGVCCRGWGMRPFIFRLSTVHYNQALRQLTLIGSSSLAVCCRLRGQGFGLRKVWHFRLGVQGFWLWALLFEMRALCRRRDLSELWLFHISLSSTSYCLQHLFQDISIIVGEGFSDSCLVAACFGQDQVLQS